MNETKTVKIREVTSNPPSDAAQVVTVFKYDILKYLRSRRLMGMLAIDALVLLLITLLPPLLGSDYSDDADSFVRTYASFGTVLVVIGATFFAGDVIVSEFQNRTGFLLFPNPVKKGTLLIGKFLASVAAMFLVLVIYYGVALLLGVGITGGLSVNGVESLMLAMPYSVAALAVGYLISTVMKGSTGALILTFALFLFIFSIITSVLSASGVDPWFILSQAGQSITDVFGASTSDNGGGSGFSMNSYSADTGVSIAVMLAYTIVALALTYVLFKRREMAA
ncbi:MAG: ABC transporter permease [Methanomassiliicoccales archaeon]|nr:ABC transporter permease [Methanomassiliicoccales archaeon]